MTQGMTYSASMLHGLIADARASARRRMNLNLHADFADPIQRFLNAIGEDSYIRPHRHLLDPKPEILLAVSGSLALVVFDEEGTVSRVTRFGAGHSASENFGVEVSPSWWHTVIALSPDAVAMEIKSGPFDPTAAKELAPWAPMEGVPAAFAYFSALRESALSWTSGEATR